MMDKVKAPFDSDQVASLNAYQGSDVFHPFTCGNADHEEHVNLVADEDGWYCPAMVDEGIEEYCTYRQGWAHAFMANWAWQQLKEQQR